MFLSLTLNFVAIIFVVKRIYFNYYISVSQTKQNTADSDKIRISLNRQNIFKILPKEKDDILFIGDSHTQFFELAEFFKYLSIKNRGISNDNTAGLLNRLDEITETCPKKVFIEIGVNDLLNNVPVDTVYKNIEKIVLKIKQQCPTSLIYVQSIFPTNWDTYEPSKKVLPTIIATNNKIEKNIEGAGAIYVPLYDSLFKNNGLNVLYDSGDSLHLNGQGYLKWKELVEKYVRD